MSNACTLSSQNAILQSLSGSSAAAGAMPVAEAVDFMSLLARCLGNMKLVSLVIARFLETGRSDLNQLQQACEQSDLPGVADVAHRLKGAASSVSAVKLHELAARAERLGRERKSHGLIEVLAHLETEWEQFVRIANAFDPATGTCRIPPGQPVE